MIADKIQSLEDELLGYGTHEKIPRRIKLLFYRYIEGMKYAATIQNADARALSLRENAASYARGVRALRRKEWRIALSDARSFKKILKVIEFFRNEPCLDCRIPGQDIEFDHIKGVKPFSLSSRIYKMKKGLHTSPKGVNELREELQKTDFVCSDCHRIREYIRGVHNLENEEQRQRLVTLFDYYDLTPEILRLWEQRKAEFKKKGLEAPKTQNIGLCGYKLEIEKHKAQVENLKSSLASMTKKKESIEEELYELKQEISRLRAMNFPKYSEPGMVMVRSSRHFDEVREGLIKAGSEAFVTFYWGESSEN